MVRISALKHQLVIYIPGYTSICTAERGVIFFGHITVPLLCGHVHEA